MSFNAADGSGGCSSTEALADLDELSVGRRVSVREPLTVTRPLRTADPPRLTSWMIRAPKVPGLTRREPSDETCCSELSESVGDEPWRAAGTTSWAGDGGVTTRGFLLLNLGMMGVIQLTMRGHKVQECKNEMIW